MSSTLEQKILARMITAEDLTEAWDLGLRAEAFEMPLYQAIFNFQVDYWRQSQRKAVPTPWALAQEFPGYVALGTEGIEETGYLVGLLKRRFSTNAVQTMLRAATTTMESDPLGTLKTLHAAAYAAAEVVTPRLTRTNMASTIEEDRLLYEEQEKYPQGIGVPYGLDLFDLHTGGQMPGELAVLGAFAKTGKTMFGLHVCAQMVRQGYRPIVFTLEMSLVETRTRLAAMFSGVSYNRLLHRRLSDEEKERLWAARAELAQLGDIAIERPEEGDRTVATLMSRARQYGADYVFIDQLSHMEAGHKTQTLKEHHGSILKQLKNEIGRAGVEIPCLLAAQLRRGDEDITIESFANASEIEREADICIGLSRNKDLRNNQMMVMEILGARRSDNAKYLLIWHLLEETVIRVQEEIR